MKSKRAVVLFAIVVAGVWVTSLEHAALGGARPPHELRLCATTLIAIV